MSRSGTPSAGEDRGADALIDVASEFDRLGPGSGRGASGPGPKPTTVRIAAWSARHRWPVLALWLVFTFGLFAASLIAGGTRSQAVWSSDQRAKFESAYADDVFNGAGASEPFESVVLVLNSRTATVRDPGFAAEIADVVGRMTALQATADGVPGPAFASVVDPLSAPPAAGLTSADGTFEGLTITLDGGDTLITGPVVDQAALHGLLKRVRDLGMPLVSVNPVEPGPPTTLGTGRADVSDVESNVGVGGLSTSNQPQQGDGE